MSVNKKYYYLKLKDDFFESDAMIVLESMPDGYIYSNILLKLYLRSLKHEGKLMFNDRIPYNSNILAQVTRHSVGDVEKAVQIFKELDLIEVLDNGAIFITDIQNFIGRSSTEADRKREYRERIEREKLMELGQSSDKCPDKTPPEREIEKEIELDIEREIEVPSKADALNEEFDKWWEIYGKKGNRKPAFQKFKTCRKKHSLDQIINGTKEYLKTVTDKKFQKHGSTFLNAEAYMDDYTQDTNYNIGASSEVASMEEELGLKTEPTRKFTKEEIEEFNREELPF